jgi:hypothetical protein
MLVTMHVPYETGSVDHPTCYVCGVPAPLQRVRLPRPRPGSEPTAAPDSVVDRVNWWTLARLTTLNQDILDIRRQPDVFGAEFANVVLPILPPVEVLSPHEAQRLVVLLGLAGASLGRHYQERDPSRRATPERAFDPFLVGVGRVPFRTYFGAVADRTGTGHCHRDSYASLVRWNVPTSEVWWCGQRLAVLPGIFDDGLVRTYTGAADERRFFELVKVSETIELAVNAALAPVHDATVEAGSDAALRHIGMATVLLEALRRVNTDFAELPPEAGMRPNHFMDVFRQFAVHWVSGDIPPSGALDPEAISRDLLLGTTSPDYAAHLQRLLPALLTPEREALARLDRRPSLVDVVLRQLRLDRPMLAGMSAARLRQTVGRHRVLAALYLLLNAHARASGVHLLLAKKFLFGPQRLREREGLGDPGVVSNRRGTTGMDESFLEGLTRARHRHGLAVLRQLGSTELAKLAGVGRVRAEAPTDLASLVRIVPVAERHPAGDHAAMATGVSSDDEARL